MSANKQPSPPSTEIIKTLTERIESFIRWVAGLIQERNWLTLLLLFIILFFFGFNPANGIVTGFLKRNSNIIFPIIYEDAFWLILFSLFIISVGIAIRSAKTISSLESKKKASCNALKGLRAFTEEDVDIFRNLQRNQIIQTCINSLTHKDFRFGILMGESGCGKTSLLQAGILPILKSKDSFCIGIYIRLDNQFILNICEREISKILFNSDICQREELEEFDYFEALYGYCKKHKKSVILLLDQFEQVFNQRNEAGKKEFIARLGKWYREDTHSFVRILVCIRSDYLFELHELQSIIGYTLSRYDYFRLKKFTPEEATNVLQLIAASENWGFDQNFTFRLIHEELAFPMGEVSPIDLQILAETIRKQPIERRALKESTFRKMGGLEGLLDNYLEESLEVLKVQNLHKTAIKVLITFTDLENNLRAQAASISELQGKLKNQASSKEIYRAINWLASDEVRLLTTINQNESIKYELAHERIIPALIKLSKKDLKSAEKANRILEQRTKEWLRNSQRQRHLLNFYELWLIHQQKLYINWSNERKAKEKLIQQSLRKIKRVGCFFTSLIIIAILSIAFWLSPTGQLWQIRWKLSSLSQKTSEVYRIQSGLAFHEIGNPLKSNQIIGSISDPYLRFQALKSIFESLDSDKEQNDEFFILSKIYEISQEISEPNLRVTLLIFLADSYLKMSLPKDADAVIEEAAKLTQSISNPTSRIKLLIKISKNLAYLDVRKAIILLELAQSSVNKISDISNKIELYSLASEAYSKVGKTEESLVLLEQAYEYIKHQEINHFEKDQSLILIVHGYTELSKTDNLVIQKGLDITNEVSEESYKVDALASILKRINKIKSADLKIDLLDKITSNYTNIEDPYFRSDILNLIIQTYGAILNSGGEPIFLKQINFLSTFISEYIFKSEALLSIAKIFYEAENYELGELFLNEAYEVSSFINDPLSKIHRLVEISLLHNKIGNPRKGSLIIAQANEVSKNISESRLKTESLLNITEALATLKQWRIINQTADRCPSIDCRAGVLSIGLITWANDGKATNSNNSSP